MGLGALLIAGGLLAAACGGEAGPPAPRELMLGVDVCEYCHMSVDDPGLAAQWVEPGGKRIVFDEPGCLVAWLREHPGRTGEAFVADAEGGGWMPVAEASFVRDGPTTSMGFNVRAYRSGETAARVAEETGGVVRDWTTLLEEGVRHAHAY